MLQSAVLCTCTCAAWHLSSRPREATSAAHCSPLPRGRSPLTAPCLLLGHSRVYRCVCECGFRHLFERRSVCVALVAVAGRRCAYTVCTTERTCRVDCSRPPSPPRTSRRPCTGLRTRDGHGRREQEASCSEQLPWHRAPVCLPGAPYSRTVLAKSGADHLVSQHRRRCLAHHRLDGLRHCDPCSRTHTFVAVCTQVCDRK